VASAHQPPMRQLRCTRRELVKAKHDERSLSQRGCRGNVVRVSRQLAAIKRRAAHFARQEHRTAPRHQRASGNFPRVVERVSTPTRGAALDGPIRWRPGVDATPPPPATAADRRGDGADCAGIQVVDVENGRGPAKSARRLFAINRRSSALRDADAMVETVHTLRIRDRRNLNQRSARSCALSLSLLGPELRLPKSRPCQTELDHARLERRNH